jgi:hypothetical protein
MAKGTGHTYRTWTRRLVSAHARRFPDPGHQVGEAAQTVGVLPVQGGDVRSRSVLVPGPWAGPHRFRSSHGPIDRRDPRSVPVSPATRR